MRYRIWLLVAVLLFAGSTAVGLLVPAGAGDVLSQDIAALQELSRVLASLPPAAMAVFILAKNAATLVMSFLLSPLLCFVPLLALTANGMLLGWVFANAVPQHSLILVLAGVLPHGIIEVPAFMMGEAAALSFGSAVILSLFRKEARSQLSPSFKKNLKYLAVAILLLVPAAVMEAFVTPAVMRLV